MASHIAIFSVLCPISPSLCHRRCFDRFADELCDVIALSDWSAVDVTVPDPEVGDFGEKQPNVAIMGRNINRVSK